MQPAQLKKVSFSVPIDYVQEIPRESKTQKPDSSRWTNSDIQSVNQVPRNVRAALSARPVEIAVPEIQAQPAQQQDQKPSWFKKALTIVGLAIAIPGTIACFALMAFLGPVALAIGFACAVVGAAITATGSKIR